MTGPSPSRRFDARQVFQWLSYLQYPAMLVALYYVASPFFTVSFVSAAPSIG